MDPFSHAQYHLHRMLGANARFRPGQWESLNHLLNGKHTLVVMPTGAGKSLIYQLAALLLSEISKSQRTALVISPLIALMKDQVDSLERRGISATYINSTLSASEQNYRLDRFGVGEYRIVYTAPERLRNVHFLEALRSRKLSLLAVDEAHCISEWGHDFRPDYLRLAEVREMLAHPLTVALTATATPQVQADIIRLLGLPDPTSPRDSATGKTERIVTGFNRPNLALQVRYASRPQTKLRMLREMLQEVKHGACIIYTGTRREAEEVADFVREMVHLPAERYHAGLDTETRDDIQDQFIRGKLNIVAATNAFGMGIDRADVRLVVHFNLPGSLEAYYQEAGRAGRDGLLAQAVLLYSPDDRSLQEWFIENSKTSPEELRVLYNAIKTPGGDQAWFRFEDLSRHTSMPEVKLKLALAALERVGALERLGDEGLRMLLKRGPWNPTAIDVAVQKGKQHLAYRQKQLDRMIAYAESNTCRRRMLLEHFGDKGHTTASLCCDNCVSATAHPLSIPENKLAAVKHPTAVPVDEGKTRDAQSSAATEMSQSQRTALILLDAVKRMKPAVGRTKLAQILRGSQARDIVNYRYDKTTYYARLESFSRAHLEGMIDDLVEKGYLKVIGSKYPVLGLTPRGEAAIREKANIPLVLPRQIPPQTLVNKKAARVAGGTVAYTEQLFREGLNPVEIAQRRGLTLNTIYNHIAELIASGNVNVDEVVPDEVRKKVEAAILKVGSVAYLAPIKAILPVEIDYPVCRCVIEAWKRKMDPDQLLVALERDASKYIQRVVQLGESKSLKDIPELIQALQHKDGNVRRLAASTLGKIGDIRAVEPLMDLLKQEEKPQVRQYAVKALGKIGDPRVRNLLESIAADFNEKDYTRQSARFALEKMETGLGTEKVDSIYQNAEEAEDDIDAYLAKSHPRPLQGPWNLGWALDFHSSFVGKDWNRSHVGQLTYRLKYQGDRSIIPELVEQALALLSSHPELAQVDAIIPTPPSTPRSNDPVSVFSEGLAGRLNLKVLYALGKTRKTAPQKEFNTLAQKRANVAGAFALQKPVKNLCVLVIDDLYDSGATLEEITRLLRKAGASRVCVLTLTRTIHSDA